MNHTNKKILPISVIMPVYNQNPAYLKESIESIIRQTFAEFEFIIVDDGSSEKDCIEILKKYSNLDKRIHILKNKTNIGLTKSLNRALEIANGKYIARMDSDDVSEKTRLNIQFEYMEKNSDCVLCGSWIHFIDEHGKIIGKSKPPIDYDDIKNRIIRGNMFTHSTWFFKKELLNKIGPYSEIADKNEDYDFLLKTIPHHKVSNIPEFLCNYRINMESISFSHNKIQEINTLKTRIRAIRKYGYSKKEYSKLIKPALIFVFVPFTIKKYLYKLIWKK